MRRNVARLKNIIQSVQQTIDVVVDCLDWRSKVRSTVALVVLTTRHAADVADVAAVAGGGGGGDDGDDDEEEDEYDDDFYAEVKMRLFYQTFTTIIRLEY